MSWTSDLEALRSAELLQPIESVTHSGDVFLEVERDYLHQIAELRPETWAELSPIERLHGLQELEVRLAEIDGRPTVEVRTEPLNKMECGYYDRQNGAIVINEALIHSSQPFAAVETVAHEGRYAYQDYAIHHPNVHGNQVEVETWRTNIKDFLSVAQFGYELYQTQPLVTDAVHFAGSVIASLFAATP